MWWLATRSQKDMSFALASAHVIDSWYANKCLAYYPRASGEGRGEVMKLLKDLAARNPRENDDSYDRDLCCLEHLWPAPQKLIHVL
jgi:hypothetical protein